MGTDTEKVRGPCTPLTLLGPVENNKAKMQETSADNVDLGPSLS